MIEAILEPIFLFLIEALVRLLYWPGWLILRIVTFGRYPPGPSESHNKYFVAGIPLVAASLAVVLLYS